MSEPPVARSSAPIHRPGATGLALGAIALWATVASFGVALKSVPPFLLTGLALFIGSMPAWPLVRQWRIPASTLLLGVYGLFGFHFLLFLALRSAPPVEANLVNYLWPLLIVVLAPVFLPGLVLRPLQVAAAVVGFVGAALAIAGAASPTSGFGSADAVGGSPAWGYLAALGSAFIWSSYSLLTRRVAMFPTAAVGLFGLVSGLLSLLCHAAFEAPVSLSTREWLLIVAMGLGPLGAAFFLWDAAIKRGDPRRIGVLSYLTPLASTMLLALASGRALTPWTAAAAVLIVGAAVIGARAR